MDSGAPGAPPRAGRSASGGCGTGGTSTRSVSSAVAVAALRYQGQLEWCYKVVLSRAHGASPPCCQQPASSKVDSCYARAVSATFAEPARPAIVIAATATALETLRVAVPPVLQPPEAPRPARAARLARRSRACPVVRGERGLTRRPLQTRASSCSPRCCSSAHLVKGAHLVSHLACLLPARRARRSSRARRLPAASVA